MTEAREKIAEANLKASKMDRFMRDYFDVDAFLTALSEAGYVVAPKEPSQPMRNAAVDAVDLGLGMSWRNRSPQMVAADIYRAMISAATPPAKGGEDE